MAIRLTPKGHLRWDSPEEGAESAAFSSLREVFQSDWRKGLFALAAGKVDPGDSPTLRYWRGLAERYLTGLCHIPGTAETFEVEPPSPADYGSLILTAPPMHGGEYLSEGVLRNVWECLEGWVQETVASEGGLEAFLERWAPEWHQVGRVCFHLAENKADEARPFAFMATYTAGFGAAGKLKHLPLRKALEQYASAKNRPALIKLLSPVQQAAETCEWVRALVDSSEIYQPMAWPAGRAYQFLRSVPALEDSGLSVRLPNWWRKRARPQVAVTIGERRKSILGAEAVLDFNVTVALGDAALSPEELAALLAGEDGLVLLKGQWVEVDREKLQEAVDHWEALQQQARDGEISFIEGMRLLAGASTDLKHEDQAEEERAWVHVAAGEAMREILAGLRDPGRLGGVDTGRKLRGTLRPYQREGLAWLHLLTGLGLGACLADDMGLGKTIQVLALLLCDRHEESERQPSLLVIPASLLGNWRQEAERFAPSLKLVFLHPAETGREKLAKLAESPEDHLVEADLVVTTYSMLTRQAWLAEQRWRMIILDEHRFSRSAYCRNWGSLNKLGNPCDCGVFWSISASESYML